jgi:hypothetical protein
MTLLHNKSFASLGEPWRTGAVVRKLRHLHNRASRGVPPRSNFPVVGLTSRAAGTRRKENARGARFSILDGSARLSSTYRHVARYRPKRVLRQREANRATQESPAMGGGVGRSGSTSNSGRTFGHA